MTCGVMISFEGQGHCIGLFECCIGEAAFCDRIWPIMYYNFVHIEVCAECDAIFYF